MCSSQPPADSTPTDSTDPTDSREKAGARKDDPRGSALPAAAWLVDGYNVLHTVLLGGQPREGTDWWGETGRDLLWERIQSFDGLHRPESAAADLRPDPGNAGPDALEPGTVWIVFDGKRPASSQRAANPQVVFAPSADQWIVDRVRSSPNSSALAVVSADHQVVGRCRHAGAQIVTPRDFIARCPPRVPPPPPGCLEPGSE